MKPTLYRNSFRPSLLLVMICSMFPADILAQRQLPYSNFDTVLGFYHPDFLSGQAILDPSVVRRLGSVSSALQGAAANEIANLSISAAGTQYFFGRDRMFYVSDSLGTYFIEPPWTSGGGSGSIGINTAYLDFRTFQGQDFQDIFDFYNAAGIKSWDGDYSLTGQLTSLSMTYGLTDKIDVGFILPLVYLDGEGNGKFTQVTNFPEITNFDESSFDLADVILRSKFEIMEVEDLNNLFCWTVGFDLKLNNGDQEKLLGTGDLGYRFRTAIGKRFGRFYPVLELAYNFAGVDALSRMTVLDPAGGYTSFPTGIEDDDFNAFEIRCGVPFSVIEEKWTVSLEWMHSNSDFAVTNDIGLSTRIRLNDYFFVQGGVRIPVDDDGLRTDFIPTIGCEYRF